MVPLELASPPLSAAEQIHCGHRNLKPLQKVIFIIFTRQIIYANRILLINMQIDVTKKKKMSFVKKKIVCTKVQLSIVISFKISSDPLLFSQILSRHIFFFIYLY